MKTVEATKAYRLNQWALLIKERAQSGQTVKDWCEENNISKDSYYSWQRKLRKLAVENMNAKDRSLEWVEAPLTLIGNNDIPKKFETAGNAVLSEMTLEVSGIKVHISSATDMRLLANVCKTLAVL